MGLVATEKQKPPNKDVNQEFSPYSNTKNPPKSKILTP